MAAEGVGEALEVLGVGQVVAVLPAAEAGAFDVEQVGELLLTEAGAVAVGLEVVADEPAVPEGGRSLGGDVTSFPLVGRRRSGGDGLAGASSLVVRGEPPVDLREQRQDVVDVAAVGVATVGGGELVEGGGAQDPQRALVEP